MIAVLFEAETHPDAQPRYLELAEALKPELKNIDGFIAIERFHSLSTPGKILSLSWWRDAEACDHMEKPYVTPGCTGGRTPDNFCQLPNSGGGGIT